MKALSKLALFLLLSFGQCFAQNQSFVNGSYSGNLFVNGQLLIPLFSGAPSNTTIGSLAQGGAGASQLAIGDGTNSRLLPAVLYKTTVCTNMTNPTSFTSLLSGCHVPEGSLTTVTNQIQPGTTIHILAVGSITVGSGGNLDLQVLFGGTSLGVPATITTMSTSSAVWRLDEWILFSSGSTCNAYATADGVVRTSSTSSAAIALLSTLTSSLNCGTSNALDFQAKFTTSNASNAIELEYFSADLE